MAVAWVLIVVLVVWVGGAAWTWKRLPPGAPVPIHAGFGGWDQYAGKTAGFAIHGGLIVFVCAITAVISRTIPPEAAGVDLVLLVPPVLVVAVQAAAARDAVRGGGGGAERGRIAPWLVVAFVTVPFVLLLGGLAALAWPRSGPTATVVVRGSEVVVDLRAPYPVLALKGGTSFDIERVTAVRVEPAGRSLPLGFRVGTNSRHAVAGTFTLAGCKSFVAMDDGREAVVFSLRSTGGYDRVIVEVDDPAATVAAVRRARPDLPDRAGDC